MKVKAKIDFDGGWFKGDYMSHPGGQPCALCAATIEQGSRDFAARFPGGYKDGEFNKAEFGHGDCVRRKT